MTSFFLTLYKAVLLIIYLYLSAALLFGQKVRRWVVFTAAYAVLYLIGRVVFFGIALEPDVGAVPAVDLALLIRLVVFLGIAGIGGFGLVQEEPWNFDRMLGAVLLFVVFVTALVVALHVLVGGRPVELPSWIPL